MCLSAAFWGSLASAQSPLALGEHNVVLNGVHLWYKVAGQRHAGKPPLIFLHGGPGYNSYSFEHTIGFRLERHTQMIYFDERGSGHSERPKSKEYGMPVLVQDIEALRQSLGLQQIALMGHSFGGTIALEYAAKHPSHVNRLIIVDGAADLPATFALWQSEIQQKYPTAWQTALSGEKGNEFRAATKTGNPCAIAKADFDLDMAALSTASDPEFRHWQQFHNQHFREEQDALDAASGLQNTGEFSRAYFSPTSNFPCYRFTAYDKLTMPTLIIVGKYDGAVGVAQMRSLASHLPDAGFDEFDQSAHFPYAEEPTKFEHVVASFLEQRATR